jgi:hypothetical protein
VRVTADPSDLIFVSVAAYCDPLLPFTLESALAQAAAPHRLRFGVVDQSWPDTPWQPPADALPEQLRRVHLHPRDARGPCYARALAMGLYQGERWFLQVDSHTWFQPGWDEHLRAWGARCAALNPRCIVTCYPNPFQMTPDGPEADVVTEKVLAHVVRGDSTQFQPGHPVLQFEGVAVESDEPVPGFHVAAGCLFAPGHLVEALPYDPQLYFHGEEQSLALRAWTRGWDLWHVPGVRLFHEYVRLDALPRPLHWQGEHVAQHDQQRAARAAALDEHAQRRLRALLWDGADLGTYGLGQARSLADYARFSGIDYAARQIDARATKQRFGYAP